MAQVKNLLEVVRERPPREVVQELLSGGTFKLERIVSTGQATPDGEWYDQETDEWVVLLTGAARLRLEGADQDIQMKPGHYINLPARCRHRVAWTDPTQATVWLALHYQAEATRPNADCK